MFLVNQSFVEMKSAFPSSPPNQFSVKTDSASLSSSPPTPPSPLPISVGPGHQKYCFSSSPSPSPPFSPHSTRTSPENTPLLSTSIEQPKQPSAFSLENVGPDESETPSSRFEACLEWLFLRCCCCRSWFQELVHTNKEKEERKHFHF